VDINSLTAKHLYSLFARAPFSVLTDVLELLPVIVVYTSTKMCSLHILDPPHLHLTTSKVTVIVWRLRGNIIRTVLYIANVLPLQWAQLTKNSSYNPVGLELVFLCFLGCMICLYVGVCFVLPWTVESFPFMFWHWRNKLK